MVQISIKMCGHVGLRKVPWMCLIIGDARPKKSLNASLPEQLEHCALVSSGVWFANYNHTWYSAKGSWMPDLHSRGRVKLPLDECIASRESHQHKQEENSGVYKTKFTLYGAAAVTKRA